MSGKEIAMTQDESQNAGQYKKIKQLLEVVSEKGNYKMAHQPKETRPRTSIHGQSKSTKVTSRAVTYGKIQFLKNQEDNKTKNKLILNAPVSSG